MIYWARTLSSRVRYNQEDNGEKARNAICISQELLTQRLPFSKCAHQAHPKHTATHSTINLKTIKRLEWLTSYSFDVKLSTMKLDNEFKQRFTKKRAQLVKLLSFFSSNGKMQRYITFIVWLEYHTVDSSFTLQTMIVHHTPCVDCIITGWIWIFSMRIILPRQFERLE
jgi:hypothetical protein